MRIGLVSDIHGNLPALMAVLADMEGRGGVDLVINLGDMVSGPLMPEETAQFLMRQTDWVHLGGNHERQTLEWPRDKQCATDAFTADALSEESRRWLGRLPGGPGHWLCAGFSKLPVWPAGVALCHGSPRSDLEYLMETAEGEGVRQATDAELAERLGDALPPECSLLACGHTHVPRVWQWRETLTLVNPGSVGLPAYDDDEPMPLSAYHRVENNSPDARYAIARSTAEDHSTWDVELLAVAYDHASMAQLADTNGRPDWAHALRTGRMPRDPV